MNILEIALDLAGYSAGQFERTSVKTASPSLSSRDVMMLTGALAALAAIAVHVRSPFGPLSGDRPFLLLCATTAMASYPPAFARLWGKKVHKRDALLERLTREILDDDPRDAAAAKAWLSKWEDYASRSWTRQNTAQKSLLALKEAVAKRDGKEIPKLANKAFETITPGGLYIIHDFMVEDDRNSPHLAALWQLQHLAFTPTAKSLTPNWVSSILEDVGFNNIIFLN